MKSLLSNILSTVLIYAICVPFPLAYSAPTLIQTDTAKLGRKNSNNKDFLFDLNLGASNPLIRANGSTGKLTFSNDGVSFANFGSGGAGGGGGVELLSDNPNFENGISNNWTQSNAGTVVSRNGAGTALFDLISARFTPTASNQTFTSTAYTVPPGLASGQCLASIRYITAEATNLYNIQVLDGSNNVLGISAIPTSTNSVSQNVYVPFTCPSSGSVKLQIISTGAAAFIDLDNAHLGSDNRLADVSQAKLMGGVVITGCASSWSTSSTTLTDFPTQAGCIYTAFGSATAPATNLPAIKFPTLPSGEFIVQYEGAMFNTTSGKGSYYRFWDGTNQARELSVFSGTTSANGSNGLNQSINYATSQSNVTLSIRGYSDSGGTAGIYGTTGVQGVIKVYYMPTSTETALRVDQIGWHVNASISGATPTLGGTTSSLAVVPATAGLSLTNISGNGIVSAQIACSGTNASTGTTCASGTPELGITFNSPVAGDVLACTNFSWNANTATTGSVAVNFQIAETSPTNDATVIQSGKTVLNGQYQGSSTGATVTHPFRLCQPLSFASSGTHTLRLFYAQTISGSINTNAIVASSASTGPVTWEVYPISYLSGALPVFRGQTTSTTAGRERVERVTFAGATEATACTTTCSVFRTSAPGTTVTRTTTGKYVINFPTGVFSAVPTCTGSNIFAVLGGYMMQDTTGSTATSSATSIPIVTFNTSGSAADSGESVICMGPN